MRNDIVNFKKLFMDTGENTGYEEGKLTEAIEDKTARLSSDTFLVASIAAMGISFLAFSILKKKHTGLFLGQWVAPFLLMGIYNKLVKQRGHDMDEWAS